MPGRIATLTAVDLAELADHVREQVTRPCARAAGADEQVGVPEVRLERLDERA
jgi:hypothetical protein